MANERISMRKIETLFVCVKKGSAIDRSGVHCGSHPVVSQYARDFAATGLSYAQITGISDSEPWTACRRSDSPLVTVRWALGLSAVHGN